MSTPGCRVAIPAQDALGESPFWDAATQTLTRVDFTAGQVHRTGAPPLDTHRPVVGFAIPCAPADVGSGLVYGSGNDVVHRHDGVDTVLARIQGEATVNDGACDARGRLWLGTYALSGEPIADLHCVRPDGSSTAAGMRLRGPNGLGWAPDNRTLYVVDSQDLVLLSMSYDLAAGRVGPPAVLHRFGAGDGVPDGLAVDETGAVWVALLGIGRLVRIDPRGARTASVALPVSRPTNLAFTAGGRALVTTATNRLTAAQLLDEPWAGSVLEVDLGVEGVATSEFVCRT